MNSFLQNSVTRLDKAWKGPLRRMRLESLKTFKEMGRKEGRREDGRAYIPEALERGAAAVLCRRPPDLPGPWLVSGKCSREPVSMRKLMAARGGEEGAASNKGQKGLWVTSS